MKVVCVKLLDAHGDEVGSSPWATLDAEYVVPAVEAAPSGRVELRIIGDDGPTPVLFQSEMFMTISTDVPSSWVASIGEGRAFDLAPSKWLRPGFWEDYFNGDPQAVCVPCVSRERPEKGGNAGNVDQSNSLLFATFTTVRRSAIRPGTESAPPQPGRYVSWSRPRACSSSPGRSRTLSTNEAQGSGFGSARDRGASADGSFDMRITTRRGPGPRARPRSFHRRRRAGHEERRPVCSPRLGHHLSLPPSPPGLGFA